MFRLSLIVVFLFQSFFMGAQDKRASYEADYQKQKEAIDAAAGASFTEVISSPGFEFPTPFVGVFPVEGKLTQLANRHKTDSFAIGDTFYISKVTWPRMNASVSLPGSDLLYAPHYSHKVKEFLLDADGYAAAIAKLKKAKPVIKPVMPVWGALFCSPLDDYGPDSKEEKYFLSTEDRWSLHLKLSRQNDITNLGFGLKYSMNKDGDNLEEYGCAEPGKSYVQLEFADGTTFKKVHEGEESCYTLTATLTDEDKLILKKKVVKIEFALAKRKFTQVINDPMSSDMIGLKLDCVQ